MANCQLDAAAEQAELPVLDFALGPLGAVGAFGLRGFFWAGAGMAIFFL
jgi:hypothetical protein